MHFIFSDEAVLLFDFWRVHSPTGKNWEGQTYSLQAYSAREPGFSLFSVDKQGMVS